MESPRIDETKLPEVMKIIERGAEILEETDCQQETIKKELRSLNQRLQELTGKETISVANFSRYWSYTDLETVARSALMPEARKTGLSDEQIAEIVRNISAVKYAESEMDYWLEVLKLETSLSNISDYIFWPDEVGMDLHASVDTIIERILEDKKKAVILL